MEQTKITARDTGLVPVLCATDTQNASS